MKYYFLLITAAAVLAMGLVWCGQFLTSFSMFYNAAGISGVAFKYGMWDGARELYNEELYGVASIIFFWSGVWPHLKLLMLILYNWIPATSRRKYHMYLWLSEFGKWSLVDVWVVTLTAIIVRLESGSLKSPLQDAWFQSIGDIGCFIFMAAIFLSQFISIMLINHYKAEAENEISLTATNLAAYNPLIGAGNGIFEFDMSSFPDDDKICLKTRIGYWSNILSVALLVLSVFVIAATFVPCYHVTYLDVFAGNKEYESISYSLFTGFVAVGQANHVGKWDVILAIVGMIFVVIFPIVQVILVIITWWQPFSLHAHKRLSNIQHHLGHWSSMDSYFLAVGVVVYEIGELLKKSSLSIIVTIEVKLLPVFYFLAAVAVLFTLLRWYILYMHSAIITATVEGEVLGQWRKPVYRSSSSGARSDSFGIGM